MMRYLLIALLLVTPVLASSHCEADIIPTSLSEDNLLQQISVTLRADTSCPSESEIDRYDWDITYGDGTSETLSDGGASPVFEHAYDSYGTYDLTIDVQYYIAFEELEPIENDYFTESLTIQEPPETPPCTEDACTQQSAQCLCGEDTAQAGQYCVDGAVLDAAPDTCGDGAPTDGNTPATGTTFTTAVASDGSIHLCGTFWLDKTQVREHEICNTVTRFPQSENSRIEYTCSVDEDGWGWFETQQGVPSISQEDDHYENVSAYLTETQRAFESIACADGMVTQAVTKYSPAPELEEGHCSVLRCYAGNDVCVPPGEMLRGHTCSNVSGEAVWISKEVRAAQKLLEYTSGDYILNCGPQQFALNDQQRASDLLGYCQLGMVSGGEVDRVLIGISLPGPEAPTDEIDQALEGVREELARMHGEQELECLSNVSDVDCSFLEYDQETGVFVFTSEDSLQPGTIESFWNFFENIFGNTEQELITQSASQIYINTETGIQRAVEYVVDSQCSLGQEIIGDQPVCYTPTQWRTVIRSR